MHVPETSKRHEPGENMQWEEKREAMMSEPGKDAKIPDFWRMSALLEICPKDVKEQMMMRLDEIGENYEILKAKVSYTTNNNKTEQTRGGQTDVYEPMKVDHVCGSESEEEGLEDVDEVRREALCYNCGIMRHFACQRKRENDERHGNERFRQIGRVQGRTIRRTERLGIPSTALDVRQGRTLVIRMSTGRRLRR